ncbi:MAG TPA: UvrD-helicase domain-containing protein [Rudaea sp.]|nr:UvrD-helicase domain-containing protein [Rudaea sp.]
MTVDSSPLDWKSMPLRGRVLIEASAGTGKTFTIGLVFLRLLLEQGLRVEQILVATFTDRAAQELRDRLRARLVEAEHRLKQTQEDDDVLSAWVLSLCPDDAARVQALRRVQLARADLDRAPIGTIHSLCQRILRDHPIESGAALLPEQLVDEESLLRECVEDFWRRRYLSSAMDSLESATVIEKGIDALTADLRGLLRVDASFVPLGDAAILERDVIALRAIEHLDAMESLAADGSLFARINAKLRSRLSDCAELLRSNGDVVELLRGTSADCFDADQLAKQLSVKGRGVLMQHTVILLMQRIRVAAKPGMRSSRAVVLREALAFCRAEIPRRARERGVQTFSMLIDNVHSRLCSDRASGFFSDTLYRAFPAALIDEFQDTDARQFDIFNRIYRDGDGAARGLLAMIGDPKQAIYGFRGGDLAAYLRARRGADEAFALTVNQRSGAPLIRAVNALYAATDGGFDNDEIRYREAQPSGTADRTPFASDGNVVTRPLFVHRFSREGDSAVGAFDERALDDCANRIVELLNDAHFAIGDEPVRPGDIAVLTRTNHEIEALRKRLGERNVPCVGTGRGSVFDADVARDLELLLYAVLNYSDERAVRGALCTRLLGATFADVRAWQDDEERFERELERFAQWHALAGSAGAQALIQAVIAQQAARLLSLPGGERIVTDLRHLGELLGADDDVRRGLESAYNRLVVLRREDGDDDIDAAKARRLRVESDAARVQLMTVHAAKGLQFPIVFVPFAWRVGDRTGAHAPKVLNFHDDDGRAWVDLGSDRFDDHVAAHFQEALQERLRLLYVAITRAKYAVHLYWTDRNGPPAFGADACKTAALDVLIHQTQTRLGLPPGEASLPAMAEHCGGIAIVAPFDGAFARFAPSDGSQDAPVVRRPLPAPRPFQWLHSFSSLTKHTALVSEESAASDEIETELDVEREIAAEEDVQLAADATLLSLDAWRGRHFGNALHEILETAPNEPVWPRHRDFLARHLSALGMRATPGIDSIEAVGHMVDRVRYSDLGDGLRLIGLDDADSISEFEFQFPVDAVSMEDLRDICARHGVGAAISPTLSSRILSGMLTGFADLIFVFDGRYHVLDYKTNWLGNRLRDYGPAPLDAAMVQHHYPLQALIYTVALHRYLRGRLDGYTADTHLGDSWYLFVRAVGLADGGVWRRRWPSALIEALDAAFSGVTA